MALVECKRSPDDIGDAFVKYQHLLAWFRGDQLHYDPTAFVSSAFPNGHFDSRYRYKYDDHRVTYEFSQSSFQQFERDAISGCVSHSSHASLLPGLLPLANTMGQGVVGRAEATPNWGDV